MSDDLADLKISEVAERTGFDASAIRYYERIELIPRPARTYGGHRVYDAEDIERLRLISNAKRLGSSLADIRAFLASWERGECPSARAMLEQLVATKMTELETTLAEITRFRDALGVAYDELKSRPTAPHCAEGCGCDVGVDGKVSDRVRMSAFG